MTKYLVLYRASATANEQMGASSPEEAQAGMEQWMQWMGRVGPSMVDMGSPLAPVASVGGGGGGSGQPVGGYSILEADSTAAVEKLLEGHPHLQMGGDAAIDVYEYLPIPGA